MEEEMVISLDIEVSPETQVLFFRCKDLYGQQHLEQHTKLAAEPKKGQAEGDIFDLREI